MLNNLFKLPRNEGITSLDEKDTILNFHFIQGSELHILTSLGKYLSEFIHTGLV